MSEASGESATTLPAARASHCASSDSVMDRAAERGQANKRKGQVIPPTT